MNNTPLLIPTVNSQLFGVSKPKEGLTVTIPQASNATLENEPSTFPVVNQHLPQLDKDASSWLDLINAARSIPGTTVEFDHEPIQEDSDVDLETGAVSILTSSHPEAIKLVYKSHSVLEDHKEFVSAVLLRESSIWDQHRVQNNPSLFLSGLLFGPAKDIQHSGKRAC